MDWQPSDRDEYALLWSWASAFGQLRSPVYYKILLDICFPLFLPLCPFMADINFETHLRFADTVMLKAQAVFYQQTLQSALPAYGFLKHL